MPQSLSAENVQTEAPPGHLALSPGWLAFAALALAIPVSALIFTRAPAAPPPVLGELPSFLLVDESGAPFGRDQLAGRTWIADFVFTSCADACPRLTQKMKRLQDRLVPLEQGGAIGLVSISVDPERDTPEKLRQYGQSFGARPGLWKWLTGPEREIERTVVKGFHLAMAKIPRGPVSGTTDEEVRAAAFDIVHGEKLVLVDGKGRIRGYYDADDADAVIRDARALTPGGRG